MLFNPIICLQQNTIMNIRVDSATRNFPVYYKDSILNTNKNFDYGKFTELEDQIIKQNLTIVAFSYNF